MTKIIAASTVIVVSENEELLLIKHPIRGWEMPQGRVEAGETFRQAAVREVKEETGIEIQLTKFCGVFQNIDRGVCNLVFVGRPIGGELTTSVESLEVGYFPIQQAIQKVAWGNFKQRIELALKHDEQPFLIEFSEKDTLHLGLL